MSQQRRRSLPGVGQERASLPTGEGFSPSGIIGPWTAGIFWSLYTVVDLGQYNQQVEAEEKLVWAKSDKKTNGTWYYFATSEAAARAKEPSNSEYGANRIWYFQTERDGILNFADPNALAKWGLFPNVECRVRTPASRTYRHEFHLISLPKAVESAARFYNAYDPDFNVDIPEYSLSELLDRNATFTDEFYETMCGDPDEKDSWLGSVLGKRRAALWAALGEEDVSKYVIDGGGRYDTEAPDLMDCLEIVNNKWIEPSWCRVVFVPDPRVKAVFGDEEKRRSRPALFEIFPDEATARVVATKEVAEFQTRQAGRATIPAATSPQAPAPVAPGPPVPTPTLAVPAKWASYGVEFWTNWLKQGVPNGVAGVDAVQAARLAECDVADINAWRAHLGL